MSYQDKVISEFEDHNEKILLLEGIKLIYIAENKAKDIKIFMSDVILTSLKLMIPCYDNYKQELLNELDNLAKNPIAKEFLTIFQDIVKNPNNKRVNFFMDFYNYKNGKEVLDVYNLLVNGSTEENVAGVSPLFKQFLINSNPSNQE